MAQVFHSLGEMVKRRIALVLWDDAVAAEREHKKKPNIYTLTAVRATQRRLKMVNLATPHVVAHGGTK